MSTLFSNKWMIIVIGFAIGVHKTELVATVATENRDDDDDNVNDFYLNVW